MEPKHNLKKAFTNPLVYFSAFSLTGCSQTNLSMQRSTNQHNNTNVLHTRNKDHNNGELSITIPNNNKLDGSLDSLLSSPTSTNSALSFASPTHTNNRFSFTQDLSFAHTDCQNNPNRSTRSYSMAPSTSSQGYGSLDEAEEALWIPNEQDQISLNNCLQADPNFLNNPMAIILNANKRHSITEGTIFDTGPLHPKENLADTTQEETQMVDLLEKVAPFCPEINLVVNSIQDHAEIAHQNAIKTNQQVEDLRQQIRLKQEEKKWFMEEWKGLKAVAKSLEIIMQANDTTNINP